MEEASKSNTEKVRGQVQKPSKASRAQELLGGGGVLSVNAPHTNPAVVMIQLQPVD